MHVCIHTPPKSPGEPLEGAEDEISARKAERKAERTSSPSNESSAHWFHLLHEISGALLYSYEPLEGGEEEISALCFTRTKLPVRSALIV